MRSRGATRARSPRARPRRRSRSSRARTASEAGRARAMLRQVCRSGRRGYTLIELLIVVPLLGISSAVVIPALGSTDTLRVQSTVRAIVADINVAQSDALAHQQGRAVVFDVANNKYSILEVNGSTLNPATDTL